MGQEDPLEKEMATYSNTLACQISLQRSLADYSPPGCKIVGHDLVTKQQNNKSFPDTYMYQIIILSTLNLYNFICQLYLSTAGRKIYVCAFFLYFLSYIFV